MGIAIAVASGKGGVGKTTACACLSAALCRENKKVLAIDCDFGLRNLDLALGLQDLVVFDLADAINEVCEVADVIIQHPKIKNLHFIAAPQDEKKATFTPAAFATLVRDISPAYDYILVDCPASLGHAFYCAIECATSALLITTPQSYSLRDAQKVADILSAHNFDDIRLIVNMLRVRQINRGYSKNIDDVIDMIAIGLIGVVPYNERVSSYQNIGQNVMDDMSLDVSRAFSNIAKRILGQRVPILKIKQRRLG